MKFEHGVDVQDSAFIKRKNLKNNNHIPSNSQHCVKGMHNVDQSQMIEEEEDFIKTRVTTSNRQQTGISCNSQRQNGQNTQRNISESAIN